MTDLREINTNIKKIIKKYNLPLSISGKSGRIKHMTYRSEGLSVGSNKYDNFVFVSFRLTSDNQQKQERATEALLLIKREAESLGYGVRKEGNSLEIRSSNTPSFMKLWEK